MFKPPHKVVTSLIAKLWNPQLKKLVAYLEKKTPTHKTVDQVISHKAASVLRVLLYYVMTSGFLALCLFKPEL